MVRDGAGAQAPATGREAPGDQEDPEAPADPEARADPAGEAPRKLRTCRLRERGRCEP